MKKVFVFCLFCFFLVFCGCSSESRKVAEEFTAFAEVKSQRFMPEGFLLTARVERSAEGEITICVTSPEGAEGLTYSWQDNFEMDYNGLVCQSEWDYLPEFSFPRIIRDVLSDLYTEGECTESDSDKSTYRGDIPGGEYVLTVDNKGYIQNISIEESDFCVDFTYN